MSGQEVCIYSLTMGSIGSAAAMVYPLLSRVWWSTASQVEQFHHVKVDRAAKVLDDLFIEMKPRWLNVAYGLGPLMAGGALLLLTNVLWMALAAAAAGLVIPDLLVRLTRARRLQAFRAQMVDAIFILSSSLRAGLSLTQAFQELEQEMTPPVSQEFGLMMKAHRLGRPLEEALHKLHERMPCEELQLLITATLVVRETGGEITTIFQQLITTLRERKKLHDKVRTLTLQGKLQAYIMSLLPIGFLVSMRLFNPRYAEVLFQDPTGQMLLAAAIVFWLLGMIMLMKLSRVEV